VKLWSWIIALCVGAFAPAVGASVLTISGGGLTAQDVNFTCLSSEAGLCNSAKEQQLDGVATVTGTITVAGGFAVFDLDLVLATFLKVPSTSGSVETLVFKSMHYTATAPIFIIGPFDTFILFGAPPVGAVTGTYDTFGAAAVPLDVGVAISETPTASNVGCTLTATNVGGCSITFGFPRDFDLSLDGSSHDLQHVFNLAIAPVPEPTTALLLLLAVAGLAARQPRLT